MATMTLISEQEATGKVKEIYEQIQKELFSVFCHLPEYMVDNGVRAGDQ